MPACLPAERGRGDRAAGTRRSTCRSISTKSATDARTQAIAAQLKSRADVADVRVVTAAEALAQFRRYSGFGEALDALQDNPAAEHADRHAGDRREHAGGHCRAEGARSRRCRMSTRSSSTPNGSSACARCSICCTGSCCSRAVLLGVGVALIVGNTIRLDVLESPRRDRGDEAGRRHGRVRAAPVPLQRLLVRLRRRGAWRSFWSESRSRRSLGRSAGSRCSTAVRSGYRASDSARPRS